MKEIHPFEPFIDNESKVLILGSFPSFASFENGFYYGHLQNQFWKIIAAVFKQKVPDTLEEKKEFLKRHHIALWDMVKGCKRENSLDSSLSSIEVNDIEKILETYPNIQAIFFTGRKSQQLFEKHFSFLNIPRYYLPSPSPAYRAMSLEEKVQKWKKILDYIDEAASANKKKSAIVTSGKKTG
ncbi:MULTISPECIES: DNA-deoxyinosine glycosylase [unclassified Nitratiruptor]|uniref:DNA-deoxyinosine glycosylase n=1 Tax=unclassified Nitratiruptor TaxID=2624044 RepID=UPI001915177A|nr:MULTISPECIES: DNA-deoxyinosine glycosylase [unclassified Nitratiruptor]BCD60157.1 A/G-specific adenine glycosylase [Nitratiruptor sp. YY08-10]BCD64354.1 A/G-specific adenine glycosylase [Nitratiruptor sp. YY08-14]